jgi:hypothetical protein
MDMTKPHKGRLTYWFRYHTVIIGFHLDHQEYEMGHFIQTSTVVKREDDQIETRNSRYTLIGDEKSYEEGLAFLASMIDRTVQSIN